MQFLRQGQIAEDRFTLLLVDWDLPGMNGDVLITEVKRHDPDSKTVLFSNHDGVEAAAHACGADAWMRKIGGIPCLRQMVNDLLQPT
jgi:DNA-binding NtrC family response regulator